MTSDNVTTPPFSDEEANDAEPAIDRPKRGPKFVTPWQGDFGMLRGTSPREAVTEAVLDLVRRGELKPGMRLPSEPQLAEMTGISRTSVREAVRSLQSLGILEIRRGQGTFISDINASSVIDAQMLMLLENHQALLDLIEVRRGIEPLIAKLAAERATDNDIAELAAALEMMQFNNKSGDYHVWRPAHLAFHTALATASQNIILMKVWGLIVLFLKDSPMVTGPHSPDEYEVHLGILDAIARHDAEAAVVAMNRHIEEMSETVR